MKIVKDDARRVEIGLPDVITAAHWQRFYQEREKYVMPGGPFPAQFPAAYLASLTLLEQGSYQDGDKTLSLKEAGLNVPAGIMVWVATQVQQVLNEALEVPKAS